VRLVGVHASEAFVERIDEDHAHAKKTWLELGSPEHPTADELDLLHAASRLVREPLPVRSEEGDLVLAVDLAPHSVTLVTVPSHGGVP
jgi:xylan 1,4-beta-xylosidase